MWYFHWLAFVWFQHSPIQSQILLLNYSDVQRGAYERWDGGLVICRCDAAAGGLRDSLSQPGAQKIRCTELPRKFSWTKANTLQSLRDDDNTDGGSPCCLEVLSNVCICNAVTCDQGNPGMVVVFGALGYWNATPLLCCCLLDVLLCFGCVGAFVAVGCR